MTQKARNIIKTALYIMLVILLYTAISVAAIALFNFVQTFALTYCIDIKPAVTLPIAFIGLLCFVIYVFIKKLNKIDIKEDEKHGKD